MEITHEHKVAFITGLATFLGAMLNNATKEQVSNVMVELMRKWNVSFDDLEDITETSLDNDLAETLEKVLGHE